MNEAILSPTMAGILLAVFSVIWIFLGWLWGRGQDQLDEYVLAGRRVGMALATATTMATWVTTSTTMVAPQVAYQLGVWGIIGYSLGSVGLIFFAPMAARIRRLMPGGFTSGDFVRLRYGKAAWRIFLFISLLYGAGWLVSLAMAGGVLIHALSGLDYRLGMSVILGICVLYTLLGGLRAVIGTDFIQTIVIVTGVAVLGYLTLSKIGIKDMHATLVSERPELLSLLMPAAVMFLFNNLLFGMGEIFHSNVWWSRAFAFGKGVGFKAFLLAGVCWGPIPIAAGFIALSAPAMDLNVPSADMVGPLVAANLLGQTGAIVVFIIVFSALASSLDSLLAATSDLVLTDIYHKHIKPEARPAELRKVSLYVTLLLGVLTWLVSLPRIDTLATVLYFTGAAVASTIWPIAAGLYWRRANAWGAALGMALGTSIGLVAYFTIGFYVAALVGAAVSMVCVLVCTWLWPENFDWDTLREGAPDAETGAGEAGA